MRASPEIIIGGFGAAGAALALALHAGGLEPGALLVLDPAGGAEAPGHGPDARILALNAGSRRLLEALGVWDTLADCRHPMLGFSISDTALEEAIRPQILDIGTAEEGEPIAHLVPLGRLNEALRRRALALGIPVRALGVRGCTAGRSRITVETGDEPVSARLLIAADGALSPIRRLAGIPTHGWGYGQTAIVATIRHDQPHEARAVQHFLPAGPFAMLPLDEYRSSLVWSERSAEARRILAADEGTQRREIARRAAGWRGEILAIEAISAHPLHLRLARRFFGSRLALVADAAHLVHPLAGQGLNLGFADVAELAELVVERLRLGLDPGAPDLLEAYQAHRRPPAVAMAYTTEGINRLFSNDEGPLRVLRDLGAGLVGRLPGARDALMRLASGTGRDAPRLLRGEPL